MGKKYYLAEAYHDEKSKAGYEGSKEGDQLQKVNEQVDDPIGECRLSNYRDMKPTMLIRYKDEKLAEIHAEAARFFVNSKFVGYSQPNRLSLKNYVKSLGYKNYKNIAKNKECDCSSLQCLCCNIAGITEVKDWNTTLMLQNFPKLTKYFDIFTDELHLKNKEYQKNGDILLRDGHVANLVIDVEPDELKPVETTKPSVSKNDKDGNGKIDSLVGAKSKNEKIAGKYTATTDVNLRYGPSSSKYDVITIIKKGEVVTNYGYYTDDWYYVRTSKGVIGFIKSAYLKKKK